MRVFVIHYPKCVERKQSLLKQFQEFDIEAEWVEHWNKEDPFVSKVKEYTKSPLPLGHLSAFLKRLWVYQKMIDEDIKEAIIFEDDVVLSPEFKNFKTGPSQLDYLRLGIGIQVNLEKLERTCAKLYRLINPGGGEAVWVTQNFAKKFLDDLNFDYAHDIVEYGFLGGAIYGYPLCHQTSLLDEQTSVCESSTTEDTKRWIAYVNSYEYLPKFSFKLICDALEQPTCIES